MIVSIDDKNFFSDISNVKLLRIRYKINTNFAMKKICLLIIITLSSLCLQAQSGLEKQTYFRIGYSLPTWHYNGYSGKSDWISAPEKRFGFILETGNIYMLNSINLGTGMKLGINVDWLSFNYHRFTYNSGKEHLFFIGSKIGPSFSFCPVQRLTLDAYFKLNPVWVAANTQISDVDGFEDQFFLGFMGLKYSIGLNVRYSVLMLGFEFNPGFARLRYYDKDENKLTHDFMGNVNDNSQRTPVPAMNFTVGVSF